MAQSRAGGHWILNGTLVTQDERRRAIRAHLRIEDGRIAAITSRVPSRLPRGTRVFDASGLTIAPGFVQAHIHLCQTLFRNQADDLELLDWLQKRIWVMEAAHTADTLEASALLGIHELLTSGTTTILDMGTVRHTPSILEAVRRTGIRASVGKCLMDHPETCPDSLRESTHEALAEAEQLYRDWHGSQNDRIRVSFAPRFVLSCTEELLARVRDFSKSHGALIHTHASENRREGELIRQQVGRDSVEHLHALGLTSPRLVLAHCIWLTEREKGLLRDTGTHAVHCPSSNLKLASGIAPVPELRSMGINVALGADGAPCNNNLNAFQEMRLAALLHKPARGPRALPAQEALDMATRGGALALGWWDDIGSIEVGKKADLVALDLDCPENATPGGKSPDSERLASQIVYASGPQHVRATWVDGKLVARNGSMTSVSRKRLMSLVQRAQTKIHKKLPRFDR